jgi:hypothetical protein
LEFKKTIEEKKGVNIEKHFGKIRLKKSPSGFEPNNRPCVSGTL